MAIGIVSDDDFEQELARLSGNFALAKITLIERGRDSNPGTPESLRKIIGTDAVENGNSSARDITKALGISDSSLSAYKHGSTSTASYHNPNQELRQATDKSRIRISTKARSRLLKTLNHITDDKLETAKLKDLATVASAMSAVIKHMEPSQDSPHNQTQFIFYAPRMRDEDSYEVIEVKE